MLCRSSTAWTLSKTSVRRHPWSEAEVSFLRAWRAIAVRARGASRLQYLRGWKGTKDCVTIGSLLNVHLSGS